MRGCWWTIRFYMMPTVSCPHTVQITSLLFDKAITLFLESRSTRWPSREHCHHSPSTFTSLDDCRSRLSSSGYTLVTGFSLVYDFCRAATGS